MTRYNGYGKKKKKKKKRGKKRKGKERKEKERKAIIKARDQRRIKSNNQDNQSKDQENPSNDEAQGS